MKIGDIVINPHVKKEFKGKPNPMYKSMIIHIGSEYTKCLRIDGKQSTYYTRDIEKYEVVAHIDIAKMIMESDTE